MTDPADPNHAPPVVRVAVATPDQAAMVYQVLREAFAEQATLDPPTGVASETIETITAAIESGQTIVALQDDAVVGTVRYDLRPASLYLGRLGVPPTHRGNGIGGALIEWCQEILGPAEGRSVIDVEIRAALLANIRLFEDHGFVGIRRYAHPRQPAAEVRVLRWRAGGITARR